MDSALKEMIICCLKHQKDFFISRYWQQLNKKNVIQLLEKGFDNFKQTVALNYFTWLLDENDHQNIFLKRHLPESIIDALRQKARVSGKYQYLNDEQSVKYNFTTLMIWEYIKREMSGFPKERLQEPLLGNPLAIDFEGRLVTQDLGNSILEYHSIISGAGNLKNMNRILEIGAGYGRTSHVVLTLHPHLQYIIVDIPPALYISQKYLSQVFFNQRIFAFRNFDSFSSVEDEFRNSRIAFLMPYQLKLLPEKSVDLFLAIDCLHEVLPEQLKFYFSAADRLSKNIYIKCWKESAIPFDGLCLGENDYPVFAHWKKIFWRECKVQTTYFEAFLRNSGKDD